MQEFKEKSFQVYRKSKIGCFLNETIDELMDEGLIPRRLKPMTMLLFDRTVCQAFYKSQDIKLECRKNMTAKHVNHNHCDSIWSFTLQHVNIQYSGIPLRSEMVELIAIESELNPYIYSQKGEVHFINSNSLQDADENAA